MMLYHFTSPEHLLGCMTYGLTLGVIPSFSERGGVALLQNYQWLTTNPSFNQAWDRESSLPYKRTAYRITVSIPIESDDMKKLIHWTDLCQTGLVHEGMVEILNSLGDPSEWYIYHGTIPTRWLSNVTTNPKGIYRNP
jgi:hypothetical protein